jgi:hypothetical protein
MKRRDAGVIKHTSLLDSTYENTLVEVNLRLGKSLGLQRFFKGVSQCSGSYVDVL